MTLTLRQLVSLGLVCLLVSTVGIGATGMTATAAAQSDADQSFLDRLFGLDTDEDGSTAATYLAGVKGQVEAIEMWSPTSDPDPEAELDALETWYNNNSASFAQYANTQLDSPDADHNVINITFVVDGESETKYLILPIENGRYQPGTIQDELTPPGTESYVQIDEDTYLVHYADGSTETREQIRYEVDDTVVVRGDATGEILTDMKRLHERFISEGEDVSHAFAKRLGSKYAGELETSLIRGEPDA